MEINLELLIDYCATFGQPLTINVDAAYENPIIIFQKGKYKERGNTKIFLGFEDLNDILTINNIIGENGKISQEKEKIEKSSVSEKGPLFSKSEIMTEKYIYETLSKYIIQMLKASSGKIYFPEINHLEKHSQYFTHN